MQPAPVLRNAGRGFFIKFIIVKIILFIIVLFGCLSCSGPKYGCKPEKAKKQLKFKGFL